MAAEQQAEAREQADVAGPVPATPGFVAPAFGSAGTRSHEGAILRLQETAGNRAVAAVLGGTQRAPASLLLAGIQRAPAGGGTAGIQRAPEGAGGSRLDAAGRAERARHAINYLSLAGAKVMKVNVEAMAEALQDMTADEGLEVRRIFEEKFRWSLRGLIRGSLEIDGTQVVTDLGPNNRRRLLLLLSGTVEPPTVDPIAAMQTGQVVGELVGSIFGKQEEVGQIVGAAAAVVTRDHNDDQARQVGARRRTAQAIQLKTWIDGGKREPIFALLRGLGGKARRAERKALADAFEAQFGTTLYIALTKRFKEKTDWDRFDALLFEDDLAKDDRVATQAHIDKVKKAEAAAEQLPGGGQVSELPGMFGDEFKNRKQKVRDAKAGLEAHLEDLRKEPAPAGPGTADGEAGGGRSRLDAALGEGAGTAAIRYEIGAKTGVRVDDLLDATRRPEALASRLAQKYKDKRLKPGDIEATLRELREAAHGEAARIAREAEAKGSTEPPPTPELVREAYFARFHTEFGAKARKPIIAVLSEIGTGEDRNRNLLLLLRQGDRSDVTDLYLALRSKTKNMDRVREILGGKTRTEIRALAEDYRKYTGTDLGTALLGDADEVRRIKFPTADDIINGRLPKDLGKARKELDEKIRLLKGEFAPEGPSGFVQAQTELVTELAATREAAGTPDASGAVPVSAETLGGMAAQVETEAERDQIRDEARFILGRISGREVSVSSNRGLFALGRDEIFGNVERDIVKGTVSDALAALKVIDGALDRDPPDLALARSKVSTLYLAEARIKHNLGVYEAKTEEAFSAFVDLAVTVVSTIATAGAVGPIVGALRATAATLAVKLVAKGPDYLGSTEFWSDVRGGVFSAAGGKLADKYIGPLFKNWGDKVIERAAKLGTGGALRTRAAVGAIKVAGIEADNLASGFVSGGLEAVVQDDAAPLLTPLSLTSHVQTVGQMSAHAGIKGSRQAYGAWRQKRAAARQAARPTTSGATEPPPRPGPEAVKPADPAELEPSLALDSPRGDGSGVAEPSGAAAPAPRPTAPPPRAADGTGVRRSQGQDPAAQQAGPPGAPRPSGSDLPSRVVGDDVPIPQTTKGAAELGMAEDSPLNKDRGRANRAEQQRRAGEMPLDQPALRASTRPDARARADAAAFDPLIDTWETLTPPARMAHIQDLLNAQLAREGAQPITVEPGTMKAGDAAFVFGTWTVQISAETLFSRRLGIAEAARLVGSAVHEARHALHHYRGIRVALARGAKFDPSVPIDPRAVKRAQEANKRRDPQDEYSKEAHDEALEIFDVSFNKVRRAKKHGDDALDPDKVIAEMDTANVAQDEAVKRFHDAVAKRDQLHAAGRAGTREYADAQRDVEGTFADARRKGEAAIAAQNRYPALPDETDAWRRQMATEGAVQERLMVRARLKDVIRAREAAVSEQLRALAAGDRKLADAAEARIQAAEGESGRLQAELDALARGGSTGTAPAAPDTSQAGTNTPRPTTKHRAGTNQGATSGGPVRTPPGRRAENSPMFPTPPLQSTRPGGPGDSGAGSQGPGGQGPRNELLAWAAEQRGPALEAARTRLAEADKAAALAESRLKEAQASGGDEKRLELEVTLAKAGVGDAQVALVHAQNMAVRARQVAEAMADRDAQATGRTGRPGAPVGPPRQVGGTETAAPATPAPAAPAPSGAGSAAGSPTPAPGGGGQNELLVWAADQAGPVLEAAQTRLTAARAARELADRQLAEARASEGDVGGRELEVALARAREGDAEVALGQAQNMAVRARRITEGLADMAARPAPPRERPLATAPPRPNELLGWATDQAGPALEAARKRLAEAEQAHSAAKQRLDGSKADDKRRLEVEVALAWAKVGDAQEALLQAQNMAVRARRVAEGIEQASAAAAGRARRRDVEPIDDPNVLARLFIEQRGFAGGNLALQGPRLENEWRTVHQQVGRRPAAGWRRADGTVVVDASNRRVREAIEHLARERHAAGSGGSGSR